MANETTCLRCGAPGSTNATQQATREGRASRLFLTLPTSFTSREEAHAIVSLPKPRGLFVFEFIGTVAQHTAYPNHLPIAQVAGRLHDM